MKYVFRSIWSQCALGMGSFWSVRASRWHAILFVLESWSSSLCIELWFVKHQACMFIWSIRGRSVMYRRLCLWNCGCLSMLNSEKRFMPLLALVHSCPAMLDRPDFVLQNPQPCIMWSCDECFVCFDLVLDLALYFTLLVPLFANILLLDSSWSKNLHCWHNSLCMPLVLTNHTWYCSCCVFRTLHCGSLATWICPPAIWLPCLPSPHNSAGTFWSCFPAAWWTRNRSCYEPNQAVQWPFCWSSSQCGSGKPSIADGLSASIAICSTSLEKAQVLSVKPLQGSKFSWAWFVVFRLLAYFAMECYLTSANLSEHIELYDCILLSQEPKAWLWYEVVHVLLLSFFFAFSDACVLQWLLDQPFYIRRMLAEFRDTCQGPPLFLKVRVTLAVKSIHVFIRPFIISCYWAWL